MHEYNLIELEQAVQAWAAARGIYDPVHGSNAKDQTLKALSEMGELADNVLKGRDVRDDIGDVLVCLINVAALSDTDLQECLDIAYSSIKNRKGHMHNGVFIKEGDVPK